jgi:hypothetical protein
VTEHVEMKSMQDGGQHCDFGHATYRIYMSFVYACIPQIPLDYHHISSYFLLIYSSIDRKFPTS